MAKITSPVSESNGSPVASRLAGIENRVVQGFATRRCFAYDAITAGIKNKVIANNRMRILVYDIPPARSEVQN